MSEKTLGTSYVLRGKLTSIQPPDKTLTKAGAPADAKVTGDAIRALQDITGVEGASKIYEHIQSERNPHKVTKAQVGLGNVNNTADTDKPVSTAQAAAIKVVSDALDAFKTGGIGTYNIGDDVIISRHIAPGAVTTDEMGTSAVTTDKVETCAITTEKMASGAATTEKIANGAVTKEKMASGATYNALTVQLTAEGWSNKEQTVAANGVTADNVVVVAASPESYNAYCENSVRCTEQAAGTLTFGCEDVPTTAITVNVLIPV